MQETEDSNPSAVMGNVYAELKKQIIHVIEREGRFQKSHSGKDRKKK